MIEDILAHGNNWAQAVHIYQAEDDISLRIRRKDEHFVINVEYKEYSYVKIFNTPQIDKVNKIIANALDELSKIWLDNSFKIYYKLK